MFHWLVVAAVALTVLFVQLWLIARTFERDCRENALNPEDIERAWRLR